MTDVSLPGENENDCWLERTEVVQAGPRLESSQSTLRVRTTSPAGVSRPRHVVTV